MTEKHHFQGECGGGVVESHWKQVPGGSVPMSRALQELCRALCCHKLVVGDRQTDRPPRAAGFHSVGPAALLPVLLPCLVP